MFRQLITACVLMGLLTAQWAAIPHSHGALTKPSHDDVPHFHLHSNGHDHDHSHGGHAHPHRSASTAAASTDDAAVQAFVEHDADAIYLAGADSPSMAGRDAQCRDQLASVQTPALLHAVNFVGDLAAGSIAALTETSSLRAPSCARFLTLRSLRI